MAAGKGSVRLILGITVLFAVLMCGLFLRDEAGYAELERLPQSTTAAGAGHPAREGQIDLNSADERTLQTLPGIGPVKAKAIVQWREENGPFRYPEELAEVNGIGRGLLERILELVTVGGQ